MNILYIDYGGVTSPHYTYAYYADIYNELCAIANVTLYEGLLSNISLENYMKFDAVFLGLGYFTQNDPKTKWLQSVYGEFTSLKNCTIPKVCLLHKPQNNLQSKLMFCQLNNIDILCDHHLTYRDTSKEFAKKTLRFWFSASPKHFYPQDIEKIYDIGFSGTTHGAGKVKGPTMNIRERLSDELQGTSYSTFLNIHTGPQGRISFEDYAQKINQSKIWLATTGPTLDVSPRYFEVMLSKTLLMCNAMPNEYENLFRDGYNCVTFNNDLSDFKDKLDYYLEHEQERQDIIEVAYRDILNNHTCKHMTLKILKKIEEVTHEQRL